ncbi:T9SS type A sorting domain-containing protein [Chryseobacterium sp. MIQD13]|uniref:T9SS type A sorting domain-containing protein n=1 Tax=Chryseobacterium sp. MIQD13 TaxID=3422310 RepID=UPI003D2BB66F
MKKKSTLKIFAAVLCTAPSHAFARANLVPGTSETSIGFKHMTPLPPSVYDLDPLIVISQNVNEKGLVVMSGQFSKPFTDSNILLSIKYQNAQGEWVTGWCKTLYSYNQYNETLKATFELPASVNPTYNVKVELSSDTNNFSTVVWNKTVDHYKEGDYSTGNCDLDENEYTMLLTPKKEGTLTTDANGKATGIKDRVTSAHSWNKLSNVLMDNKKNDVVFSPANPSDIITESNGTKSVKLVNTGAISNSLGSTPEFIYNEMAGHPIPYLYSYDDPVYMFAGKFSANGFFIKFSQWPGEPDGPGYFNFKNPTNVESRYFNLYNRTWKNLAEFIPDQEPVVIVSSLSTGLRIYKSDGTYIDLNPSTTSNYGGPYFGYTNYVARRGPGSENLLISDTSEMTLYGVGALRNDATLSYEGRRSLQDIEREISKFIKYTGVFGNSTAYKNDSSECSVNCFTINPGAQPSVVADWTKAPNSYIFTGKDKKNNNADVDGLYIPVKKAYEMWSKGGEFMKDDSGNYTPIPELGIASAGLYWEDETGLIKSVSLEGTGENAKIKVLVNKLKEGNAVVSYKVDNKIYWTWHVWVTDDPTDGSTYHQGFEKDKEGNLVTDWKWMDRNLGATNAKLTGNGWDKTKGLQYQWGRKDPFPVFKIDGEAGKFTPGIAQQNPVPVKFRGNIQPNDASGNNNNTGFDSPNGNIRYSIKNPINYIVPPVYIYKIGETPVENGENYAVQGPNATDWVRKENTTWFSKNKFKTFDSNNYYNNVAWDLWGDTRGGKWTTSNPSTSDQFVLEKSKYYSMKSPYDPCPCEWRVPSFYSSVAGDANASPWGKEGRNTTTNIIPDSPSSDYPGIKVYPSYGFDFNGVSERNLGVIPINGNYEYYPQPMTLKDGSGINRNSSKIFLGMGSANKGPEAVLQDQITDGALHSSTFFTYGAPSEIGTRGLVYVSDAGNVPNHSNLGWHFLAHNRLIDGNTYESRGVRCIKDPNNSYMPTAFNTEYVYTPASQYTLEQLKSWAKEPNSYIEYTNSTLNTPNAADKDRVIDIPLRKAYAMQKLYLSENSEMPAGNVKSTSVVWTTDQTLISSIEIIDNSTLENAKLRVTLKEGRTGNAVVAFHLGSNGTWSNGNNTDPIMWSWHIWAPQSVVQEYSPAFKTENGAFNGIKSDPSGQFINPVKSYYGVPLTTTFMDRDLGAQAPFLDQHFVGDAQIEFNGARASASRVQAIKNSGGLHYQWGRKDPIPVFYYAGGFYEHDSGGSIRDNFRKYSVYKQTGINAGNIVYTAINEAAYETNYSKAYSVYSNGITANDTKYDKIKKVLKYSVNNPSIFMYQPASSTAKDWISDENGLAGDRWGHAVEKSPYDPCPEGWRIPDTMISAIDGVNLFDGYHSYTKGNTPWFYNASFIQNNKPVYGIDPSNYNIFVNNEAYDANKLNYIGGYVRSTGAGRAQVRYGFILNRPEYNIGNFPNNGIRGYIGGNSMLSAMKDLTLTGEHAVNDNFKVSGIWTSSPATDHAIGMLFNTEIGQNSPTQNDRLFLLTPINLFRPQAAMSCRCAKIEYDGNGNEIGRYDPLVIPVPKNTAGKAATILPKKQIEEIQKDSKKLTVFPNPVKSTLYINADDKDYYYQIYNISGQLVKQGKFENRQTDVSSLSQGAYLVRINNSETIVKIIKQ